MVVKHFLRAGAAPQPQVGARVQALIDTEFRLQLASKEREYQARAEAMQRGFEAQLALKTWTGSAPPPPPLPTISDGNDAAHLSEGPSAAELYKPETCQLIDEAVAPRLAEQQKLEQQLRTYEHTTNFISTPSASTL